jgi:hypothetical protein
MTAGTHTIRTTGMVACVGLAINAAERWLPFGLAIRKRFSQDCSRPLVLLAARRAVLNRQKKR